MVYQERINEQLSLLKTYRQTLSYYLQQAAMLGVPFTPPSVMHGIRDSREQIERIKSVLRSWHIDVDDHPNDSGNLEIDSSEHQFLEKLLYKSSMTEPRKSGTSNSMRLVDYLYVDNKRLDTYVEQVLLSPDSTRAPIWNVQGENEDIPSSTLVQRIISGPKHLKIKVLMNYLNRHNLVFSRRPNEDERWETDFVFCLETIRATKIIIPPKPDYTGLFSGFSLWVSVTNYLLTEDGNKPLDTLFLLEDFQQGDKESPINISAYSALELMVNDGEEQLNNTILNKNLTHNDDFSQKFSIRPIDCLVELGSKVVTTRTIHSLYRVRAFFNEQNTSVLAVSTIGYPIFITTAQ